MAQNHIVPFGVQQLLELLKGSEWVHEVKTPDKSDIVDVLIAQA